MVRLWTNLCQPCFFHIKSFLTYKCTTYAYTPPYSCSAPLLVPLGYTVIFDCQNNSFSNVIYQVRQLSVMLSSEIVWYLFAYMNSLLDSFTYPFGIQIPRLQQLWREVHMTPLQSMALLVLWLPIRLCHRSKHQTSLRQILFAPPGNTPELDQSDSHIQHLDRVCNPLNCLLS